MISNFRQSVQWINLTKVLHYFVDKLIESVTNLGGAIFDTL